jgi:hypothetical protein
VPWKRAMAWTGWQGIAQERTVGVRKVSSPFISHAEKSPRVYPFWATTALPTIDPSSRTRNGVVGKRLARIQTWPGRARIPSLLITPFIATYIPCPASVTPTIISRRVAHNFRARRNPTGGRLANFPDRAALPLAPHQRYARDSSD